MVEGFSIMFYRNHEVRKAKIRGHVYEEKEKYCKLILDDALRKKCPYSELFWSAFSGIRTEYGEILSISPYSVRMREKAGQNNTEYGHFSGSDDDDDDKKIQCEEEQYTDLGEKGDEE